MVRFRQDVARVVNPDCINEAMTFGAVPELIMGQFARRVDRVSVDCWVLPLRVRQWVDLRRWVQ